MENIRKSLLAVFAALLLLASGVARAEEIPLVTGVHWTSASVEQKKAYLIGIANIMQLEAAYEAGHPPGDGQSVIPRFVRGLKGQTLDSVRQALDTWYAGHADQLQRPVIETIWFELVVPGLRTNR